MSRFLIWSNQKRMWWRADRRGYTDTIEEAGRYDRDKAEWIVRDATLDGQLSVDTIDPVTGLRYRKDSEVMVLAPESIGEQASADGKPYATEVKP